jgi:hypothetical protein
MKISNRKFVPEQDIELYVGIEVQLHLFLTQVLDWVSAGIFLLLLFYPGQKPPVFAKQEAGWLAKQVRTIWGK